MKKALAAGLFIAGLLLLYFGYQEYQSFGSEVEQFFTGSPSNRAIWLIIAGAVASVVGLVGLLRK